MVYKVTINGSIIRDSYEDTIFVKANNILEAEEMGKEAFCEIAAERFGDEVIVKFNDVNVTTEN